MMRAHTCGELNKTSVGKKLYLQAGCSAEGTMVASLLLIFEIAIGLLKIKNWRN